VKEDQILKRTFLKVYATTVLTVKNNKNKIKKTNFSGHRFYICTSYVTRV